LTPRNSARRLSFLLSDFSVRSGARLRTFRENILPTRKFTAIRSQIRPPCCLPGARHQAGPMACPDQGAPTGRSGAETYPVTRDPSRTNGSSAKPPALDNERAIATSPLDHIRSAPRRDIGPIDLASPDLGAIHFGFMAPMRDNAFVRGRRTSPLRCIGLEWRILLRRVSWRSRGRGARRRIQLR
jgi:hypothetical protein